MERVEEEISVVDIEKMISDVWLYVNPLTGKHAKTSHDKKLAVFVTEKVGRRYQGSVSNRSAIPKKKEVETLTKEEMELEYLNELDDEIQKIKKQERK